MAVLPFPEFRPDVADYQGNSTRTAVNVVPRGDGYGPVRAFQAFTVTLAEGNDQFTKVLLHLDGADASTTITDSNAGGSAHTWTANGNAQIDTAISRLGGAALLCDGTGDYVSTPDHADFNLGSGDFTIDCWFNCVAASGAQALLAGQMDNAATAATISFFIERNTGDVMRAFLGHSGTATAVAGTTQFTNLLNTGWHHLAFVREGTSIKLYVDGVLEGTSAIGAVTAHNSANALAVGRGGEVVASTWNGSIDEFRLSAGIARNTSDFTPPQRPYDTAANAACRGFFYARKTDGSIAVFAGTATRLLQLDTTTLGWIDVSKDGLAYAALSATAHWQFAQFGNLVIAVQANVPPQVFNLSSSTDFGDLSGSPPQAAYIAIVGQFVVLTGLLAQPFRIQWSAIGDATGWVAGTNSSDFQDFPDGGIVRGVAGGEYGVVFQETIIRRMIFHPGSAVIFAIEKITEDQGLLAPYSIVRAAARVFFAAPQGLYAIASTGLPEPIGKERVDRTFLADVDKGALHLVIGAADPEESRIYFAYKSAAFSASRFNKIISFDYALKRWGGIIEAEGDYLASLARPGISLESLDSVSASLDALTFSLDDVAVAALARLSIVDANHMLGFFTGDTMEATIDTAEQALDMGRRVRVKGLRPITDAATCFGAVVARETPQQATPTVSTEQAVNARGLCPANVSTRLARGRIRIPAATPWTYAMGFEPEFVQEGRR